MAEFKTSDVLSHLIHGKGSMHGLLMCERLTTGLKISHRTDDPDQMRYICELALQRDFMERAAKTVADTWLQEIVPLVHHIAFIFGEQYVKLLSKRCQSLELQEQNVVADAVYEAPRFLALRVMAHFAEDPLSYEPLLRRIAMEGNYHLDEDFSKWCQAPLPVVAVKEDKQCA